jgi:hypothetical protein
VSIDLLALRSSHAAILLAATTRIVVASGMPTARTLAEAYPGRFVLRLGVSTPPRSPSVAGRIVGPSKRCAPTSTRWLWRNHLGPEPSLVADDGGGSFTTSGSAPSILCFDVAATAGVAGSAT